VKVTAKDTAILYGSRSGRGKEDLPVGKVLELENFRLSLRYSRPSQQLMSCCRRLCSMQAGLPVDDEQRLDGDDIERCQLLTNNRYSVPV